MTFTGVEGSVVLIDGNNTASIAPSDGAVFVDAASGQVAYAGKLTGDSDFLTQIIAAFTAKCAVVGCPTSSCAAKTSIDEITGITCHSESVWRWPDGVALKDPPTAGRQLKSCFNSCNEKNSYAQSKCISRCWEAKNAKRKARKQK